MWKPELLAPAGSLEKLKVATAYGASAVYLAGQNFGLRSAADNFSIAELEEGINFAHEKGTKVYVVLNSFPHDADIAALPSFVRTIAELGVDGVIASDLGVVTVVSQESKIPIHLSTQASCLNVSSGQMWKKLGVTRLILGREVSIEDAGKIKRATGLEVELFIHGSMCMAYSGNCTISNFTKGRDSNRGGCAQSCRFNYDLKMDSGTTRTDTFFMSSKDLMGIDLLPIFFKEKIDSVKIEGRMRSSHYAGASARAYRQAIDAFMVNQKFSETELAIWRNDLARFPHRDYMSGSLDSPADLESTLNHDSQLGKPLDYLGVLVHVEKEKYSLLEVRNPFLSTDDLEVVPFEGQSIFIKAAPMLNSFGKPQIEARVNTLVRLPYHPDAREGNFVRRAYLQ